MDEKTITIIFCMDCGNEHIWYDAKESDYDMVLAKMINGAGVVCFKRNPVTETCVAINHVSNLQVIRENSYFNSDPLSDSEK